MISIEKIAVVSNRLHCKARLKLKDDDSPEAWANGIGFPAPKYVELCGPWLFREVEWIEINPIVIDHISRLIAPKQWNHLGQIVSCLKAEGVNYSLIQGMVRIPFEAASN